MLSTPLRALRLRCREASGIWIYQLGGLGFIPLGLLDNSVIPIPGSMDVLTIFLAARREQLWLYYAIMATAGSATGGFVIYRLARKGGKETLARRVSPTKLEKVYIYVAGISGGPV